MRTLLLTLAMCLLVLPAQAKYSGGSGTAQDPYQIGTAADLIALGETPADYDKHFLLTADIDLDPKLPGRKVFDKAVIAPAWWTAGTLNGTPFTGVFDGNGHTISHLTIKGASNLGLFGALGSGGEVKNLGVVNVNITGSGSSVGGLVGYNGSGTVTRCYSTGAVTGTTDVGGLVGQNGYYDPIGPGTRGGTIRDCHSAAVTTGSGFTVGGLVGYNADAVTQCHSAGAVSATGKGSRVGGLVGANDYGNVTQCHSTGAVSAAGQDSCVGGLVGANEDTNVTQCYSTGAVSASGQSSLVGGLVGSNGSGLNPGFLTECYSTGPVSASGQGSFVGGLVGDNNADGSTVTQCYGTGAGQRHWTGFVCRRVDRRRRPGFCDRLFLGRADVGSRHQCGRHRPDHAPDANDEDVFGRWVGFCGRVKERHGGYMEDIGGFRLSTSVVGEVQRGQRHGG